WLWVYTDDLCPDSISYEVIIVGDYILFAPSAFTPNGDGKNDFFKVVKYGQLHAPLKLLVFNRWGQLKYQSDDYKDDWDGRDTEGQILNEDTYYYILNYADKVTWTGWVFLMKNTEED
ncbi:MAG: gliding motility-associated C-terminal domain-containing protein, partial [Bacteroidetes bacterium]|nr:gliding motility-associated C-terminal domain-containing protein [Bacteroidota bacterium]